MGMSVCTVTMITCVASQHGIPLSMLDVAMITQAWGLFTNAVDADAKDCGSLCDCAIGTATYKASSGRT